jgi:hypothetical protein
MEKGISTTKKRGHFDFDRFPRIWLTVDYTADFLYLLDTFVRAHEGFLEQGPIFCY